MASEYVIGSSKKVSALTTGDTMILGDVDDTDMGAFHVHFVDAAETGGTGFSGSLRVVTRSRQKQASDDGVQWRPTPYRKIFLNGAVAADFAPTTVDITTTSVVLVPSSGAAIALLVTCAAGSGMLYITPTTGESAVG